MPNNVSFVMDDAFNYSMWVEIYSLSSTDGIDLNGFYFTDDLSVPTKWHPSSAIVPAKGYKTLWFEREDRAGHAPFKLDPEGGKLYLLDRYQQLVDSVRYPAQYRNISYGRQTDNASNWVFFEQPSPGSTNNNMAWATQRCPNPVYSLKNGFYLAAQLLTFNAPAEGNTIYFTTDGSEPTSSSLRYVAGSSIAINATRIIRAKTVSSSKLSSDVVTSTYFINQRTPNLPVISISTTQANLTDPKTGIYCNGDGTNGLTGNGQSSPRNYNCDWDRPVNFELFDKTGTSCLNQEVDITILGGWTRAYGLKSISISPRKKHGNNMLNYDVFAATKPGHRYKDIQMRNSGNDFGYSQMRDAFMQSLIIGRMDLDYQAYEPAVIFINGAYYGIENLRERTSKDYIWSNYGLDEDDITLYEATLGIDNDKDIETAPGFLELSNYLINNNMSLATHYDYICQMMDVDEYINYMIPEIYVANTDWPHNNCKMWKKNEGGKWRWILYDTDFGYGLYNNTLYNHNTLARALGESESIPAWSTVLLKRLVTNQTFLNKFIDRFAIHISTTYEASRANQMLDSLANNISTEITYHKAKWGSSRDFNSDISVMKTFSANRPEKMLGFINNRFLGGVAIQNIQLRANVSGASYCLNSEPIIDSVVNLKYFKNRSFSLVANPIPGYTFKHWGTTASSFITVVPMGSTWKFFDGNTLPAVNWNTSAFSDASWNSGPGTLGYSNDASIATLLSYGSDATSKNTTAYFRKVITIDKLSEKTSFEMFANFDDGIIIYINGNEVGRSNMPSGAVAFNTFSTTYFNGTATFSVPVDFLKEGSNLIAAEVHQCDLKSSDLLFNLQLTCSTTGTTLNTIADSVYEGVMNGNLDLIAVYEVSEDEPVEDQVIFINEVVSSNQSLVDEFGETDDYIELYNNGSEDVDIAGWYLSDVFVNRTLYQIPSTDPSKTVIPSKGRIVLWADDQAEQGILHLGFKLDKDGETIYLSEMDEGGTVELVDSVTFPDMASNMSYARVPDGSAFWVVQAPTWNSTNDPSSLPGLPVTTVAIYPTLVTESFTVLNASGSVLTIRDLAGKTLSRSTCQSDHESIPASDLRRGMYIVRVDNQTFKIVKK